MTYLVTDGKVFIADKFCSVEMKAGVGQRELNEDGIKQKGTGRPTKIHMNNACKIELLKNGYYEGKKLKLIAAAGNISHLGMAIEFLERGNDINTSMDTEAVLPAESRLFFRKTCSYIFVNEDNVVNMALSENNGDSVIRVMKEGNILHSGSGSAVVRAVDNFLTRNLTPLEAFCLASQCCDTVSEEFDYYDLVSNKLVTNQKLTPRQRTSILDKIQDEMAIKREFNKLGYANEIYKSVSGR